MDHFPHDTVQRIDDDDVLYIHRLCAELDRYKAQNQTLHQQLAQSRRQIYAKDQLLNERSRCIMRCRAENMRLKEQIKILESSQSSKSPKKTRKRKKMNGIQQMPYMVTQAPAPSPSVCTTTLSEEACKISLPSRYDSQPSPIKILAPIHEIASDSHNSYRSNGSGSPCNVMNSDDNQNIVHDEWQHCFASIDSISPKADRRNSRRFSSDDEENEEFSCSITEYMSDNNTDLQEPVSYMSDNTDLWMDIHDDTPLVDISDDATSHRHFPENSPKIYTETSFDQTRGCDMVVISPVIDFMGSRASYV